MRKRAMTSAEASEKKLMGHKQEHIFAECISGEVNKGGQTNKKDVVDDKHRIYSVKSGEWWQIFLYSRSRFLTNTAFRGLGKLSGLLVKCIDAFPESWEAYKKNKMPHKIKLQTPMKALCEELNLPNMLAAFFNKALFNGGEVNYLSILPAHLGKSSNEEKIFHVFASQDVENVLASNISVVNSFARHSGQVDCQKVLFRTDKNIGEIEIRTDSKTHHRGAKCRVNGVSVLNLLSDNLRKQPLPRRNLVIYGKAIKSLADLF